MTAHRSHPGHHPARRSASRFARKLCLLSGALAASLAAIAQPAAAHAAQDPVDWVNPYIGTGSGPIGYGGTMPFVTPPFGMTNWTAQTRQNRLSVVSYNYEDTTITGFMGTHQPAIWMGDYGYITVVPEVDSLKISPEDRKLAVRAPE